jgi:hypothetical protein
MRGNLIAEITRLSRLCFRLHLLEQMTQLVLQQINLLLLPINGTIKHLNQIFGEVYFDFQFGQTVFHEDSWLSASGSARLRR